MSNQLPNLPLLEFPPSGPPALRQYPPFDPSVLDLLDTSLCSSSSDEDFYQNQYCLINISDLYQVDMQIEKQLRIRQKEGKQVMDQYGVEGAWLRAYARRQGRVVWREVWVGQGQGQGTGRHGVAGGLETGCVISSSELIVVLIREPLQLEVPIHVIKTMPVISPEALTISSFPQALTGYFLMSDQLPTPPALHLLPNGCFTLTPPSAPATHSPFVYLHRLNRTHKLSLHGLQLNPLNGTFQVDRVIPMTLATYAGNIVGLVMEMQRRGMPMNKELEIVLDMGNEQAIVKCFQQFLTEGHV